MQYVYKFTETSPAAPGGAASSQVVTGSGPNVLAGVAQYNLDAATGLFVVAQLVGATGGPLDVYLQHSPDYGLTWVDYAHFTQLAAAAPAVKYQFAVSSSAQVLTPVTVGINNAPALAAGTVVGGAWGERFRLWMVAGALTTVGAPVSVTLVATRPGLFP